MREQAFALIIKEAKKSVFDGWTDWRYDLLKCGICLCDEKSAKKLEKVLDTVGKFHGRIITRNIRKKKI